MTLFVTLICTDDPHDAMAPNDFALATDAFHRCQHFHDSLLITRRQVQPTLCRIVTWIA
ncbi:hypothetical protein ACCAA_750042 [Candidatus Accumulibacter aalborgensis]|uniref:Uncharacterized protein n=1 Tax=Candidatus Accumulibacter aalborgensis TaxID=1860102 RepID=A0A1A8XXI4_9PROT|nr:hypothetical protein ACCAA_750042 [Candidatus Accumulibacter aalborgensis]